MEINVQDINKQITHDSLILDGDYLEFYPNGDTMQYMRFKKGVKIGMQIRYNPDKSVQEVLRVISPTTAQFLIFYPDKKIKMQFTLINNRKEGDEIHYYENGGIKLKANYLDDRLEGVLTEYYPNKKIKRIEEYHEGHLLNEKCLDIEGNEGKYYPLVDSLKIENDLLSAIQKLQKTKLINEFMKKNDLKFVCEVLESKNITNFEANDLPDTIINIIKNWFSSEIKVKPEYFCNEPVHCRLEFDLNLHAKSYNIKNYNYSSYYNNHFYSPYYI